MKPRLGYLICHSSRSGSGVLGDTLWRTGLAGKPDQYFYDGNIAKFGRSWGVEGIGEYLDALLERTTTPNGVFGLRLSRRHMVNLRERLAQCGQIDDAANWDNVVDLLAGRFPTTRYVWLRRRDTIRQAISKWRRVRGGPTKRRIGEVERNEPAHFAFEIIEEIRRQYEAQNRAWAEYFESRHIAPLALYYEDDIETDVPATVRRVLAYLDIYIPPDLDIAVSLEKLADAESDRLFDLFREVEAARSRPRSRTSSSSVSRPTSIPA